MDRPLASEFPSMLEVWGCPGCDEEAPTEAALQAAMPLDVQVGDPDRAPWGMWGVRGGQRAF